MTASMAGVVLCSALLSAMALWYGVRMGAVPLSRRLAAMAIPLTQACALVAFGAFAMRDPFLDRFVPYVVFATVACLVADGLALPSLSLGARKESAQDQARAAAELLEATRQGAAAARREVQEADDVRRGMVQVLNRAIEQCGTDEVVGAGELAVGSPFARYCRNDVVDALLALKARRAGEEGVAFEVHADVPARVSISDVDLCALFSNMLDNGINGAVKAEGQAIRAPGRLGAWRYACCAGGQQLQPQKRRRPFGEAGATAAVRRGLPWLGPRYLGGAGGALRRVLLRVPPREISGWRA